MSEESDPRLYHAHVARNRQTVSRSMSTTPVMVLSTLARSAAKARCEDAMEQLLDLGHWGFQTVKGIINSPTMRSDGSLLTEPGYDPATQLWYKPSGNLKLEMGEHPTKDEARRALETIEYLLSEFPFKDDGDGDDAKDKGKVSRAVAVAAIMTPVMRGAFDFAPIFYIIAPESGSGKTYLVTIASTVATGRAPTALAGVKDENEMEKRLSAVAFSAPPIVNLNNLNFDSRPSASDKRSQTSNCSAARSWVIAGERGVRC
jgi:hypothetical protein